ncbi:MAG: hypothetical protein HYZ71_10380 [Deltaproteobacteria bacterium]|nr:hypothetical protein [Deltaproteobacteria bacterium]
MRAAVSLLVLGLAVNALAEYEEAPPIDNAPPSQSEEAPTLRPKNQRPATNTLRAAPKEQQAKNQKYFVPDTDRVDAGVFHVAFAAGGNFYIEPEVQLNTNNPTGNYFKDFGFQAGAYFDYDYSELPENIPLALRGMVGYKYVLNSAHVFTFDGMVRKMFRFSDNASFGVGLGGSAALWYRQPSATQIFATEQMVFLPSLLIGAGFDFTPFMIDFKWLVNRIGSNTAIMGFELYFGFRL